MKTALKSKLSGAVHDIHVSNVDRMAAQGFHHLRKSGGTRQDTLGGSASMGALGIGGPGNAS